MRDVLPELVHWWRMGHAVGMGTVVDTFRSAPRPPGAAMLVGPDATAVGSVSGGCIEGAVYERAQAVVRSGRPVLEQYGVSDDDALGAGLTCGGALDVFIEVVSRETFPELGDVATDIENEIPVAIATVVEHPDPDHVGRRLVVRRFGEGPAEHARSDHSRQAPSSRSTFRGLGSARTDRVVRDDVLGMLAAGRSGTLVYGPGGQRRGEGMRVFVNTFAPRPRLLVFGAIDFASAMARVGSFLGFRVTVCDARPIFATTARFPEADEVVVAWPHRYLEEQAEAGLIDPRTVITVLTHDPKFDVPLLRAALALPGVGYIGAMGSRRAHEDRSERLREAGVNEQDIGRIASPIGLDLGARTPEETAVSIAAEIVAMQWGGTGRRLRDHSGVIHRDRPPVLPISEVVGAGP